MPGDEIKEISQEEDRDHGPDEGAQDCVDERSCVQSTHRHHQLYRKLVQRVDHAGATPR